MVGLAAFPSPGQTSAIPDIHACDRYHISTDALDRRCRGFGCFRLRHPPPASDPEAVAEFKQTNDPLEPMNRAIFNFNGALDTVFLTPLAKGYRAVVPPFGRDRVSNFLDNLGRPSSSPMTCCKATLAWRARRSSASR